MVNKAFNPVDARSWRGIFSRGQARYGVAGAPRVGNLQEVAKRRLKEKQQINGTGRRRPQRPN